MILLWVCFNSRDNNSIIINETIFKMEKKAHCLLDIDKPGYFSFLVQQHLNVLIIAWSCFHSLDSLNVLNLICVCAKTLNCSTELECSEGQSREKHSEKCFLPEKYSLFSLPCHGGYVRNGFLFNSEREDELFCLWRTPES